MGVGSHLRNAQTRGFYNNTPVGLKNWKLVGQSLTMNLDLHHICLFHVIWLSEDRSSEPRDWIPTLYRTAALGFVTGVVPGSDLLIRVG